MLDKPNCWRQFSDNIQKPDCGADWILCGDRRFGSMHSRRARFLSMYRYCQIILYTHQCHYDVDAIMSLYQPGSLDEVVRPRGLAASKVGPVPALCSSTEDPRANTEKRCMMRYP